MHRDQSNDRQVLSDEFDPESTAVSAAVVRAVADATDAELRDLDPLYDTVDPEALNALFEDPDSAPAAVSFEYHGCVVSVRGHGEVVLTDATGEESEATT